MEANRAMPPFGPRDELGRELIPKETAMYSSMRQWVKPYIPRVLKRMKQGLRQARFDHLERQLPLQNVFSSIYEANRWGGKPGEFYSGGGSDEAVASLYIKEVKQFIADHSIRSIVDIGCGDFRVSRNFISPDLRYTGCDIVLPLIQRNNVLFGSGNVTFQHCNAVDDPLPHADLCLIRQVLQHLSNTQIATILGKLHVYKYILVSEHHPARLTVPNKDKMAGSGIRVPAGSGVYLEAPPFSMKNAKVLFETPSTDGERISTYLVVPEAAGP